MDTRPILNFASCAVVQHASCEELEEGVMFMLRNLLRSTARYTNGIRKGQIALVNLGVLHAVRNRGKTRTRNKKRGESSLFENAYSSFNSGNSPLFPLPSGLRGILE